MFSFKKVKKGASTSLRSKASAMSQAYRIVGENLTQATIMAKSNHRFKARSGNLERSIQTEVHREKEGVIGVLMIKDSVAAYGYYVSKGHGTWKPDPFLRNARNKYFKIINRKIKAMLKKGAKWRT